MLLALLALAAVVRLWNLDGQPLLYFDSGVYLGEGAFLASVAQRAAATFIATGSPTQVARALQDGTDAHPPDIAKPAHAILLAISMLLLGKSAFAGALVSALAAIGTVAFTYAIGLKTGGPRVAIPAAVLLAVSGQHLAYSREPLVESDGLFFATAAALVYLNARGTRGLFASGVLWGLAFACNNRISYLPLVLLLAELADWRGLVTLLRRGAAMIAGALAPLAAIEALYLGARAFGRAAGARTDWLDYLQQLAAFSRMNPPDRLRPDEWPTYFVDLALMDGLPVLALLLVGLGVLLLRIRTHPSRPYVLLAASLLVPLALYSVYSTGEVRLRHFSLAIPWVMLTAALGLDWLASVAHTIAPRPGAASALRAGPQFGALGNSRSRLLGLSNVDAVRTVLTLGIALLAVPRIVAFDTAPNGMPSVMQFIGAQPVASTNGPVIAFFTGEDRTNARLRQAFVNLPSDLDALGSQYPLLIVDMQAAVFAGALTDIYARATPVYTVPHGNDAWYLADLLEHFGTTWGTWDVLLQRWRDNRLIASELRVYRLSDLVVPNR